MSLPNDKFGRTVTMTTVNGQDTYVAVAEVGNSVSVSFPTGTPQAQVYNSLNGMVPAGWLPPAIPLNEQYTPQEFGQYLIYQFSQSNGGRGMTSDQNLQIAQTMGPYFILASAGDLKTLSDEIPKIPVDGVLITQGIIDQFSAAISAYLNGN